MAKPQFDPSKPFEPAQVEGAKPTFDPSKPFEESTAPEEKKVMPIESAARGLVQGGTLGFADEISGGAEALWQKAKGDPTEFGKLYQTLRDESRANFDKAQKDNPSAYTAGEVGGGLATAAIPFGGTATLGKALLAGARTGAVASLGASTADNAADMVEDVAKGTAMGAIGGGIASGVGKGLSAIKGRLGNAASKQAGKLTNLEATASGALSKESGSIPIDNPNVLKEAGQSAKQRLKSFFNPEVDPTFEEFADIAKKHNIDPNTLPESVKFGPDSSASRASRNLAEGRFGEETLKRFNKSLDQVRDAYDNKIQTYSKGVPVDEVTAGKILRDSYDEGVTKFFDKMDFTHNSIIDQVPGLQMTPESLAKIESSLGGIEKFAKGRLQRGVTATQRQQGQQLLNATEAIRAGNGSYKQTVEALRDIGEAAFQSKNSLADVPVDTAKMRKIYNDLNEGLLDTVRSNLGDDIANDLIANNKAMSEFFGEKSLLSRVMGDKAIAPENAFRSLVLNGDTQKLAALKKVLPPEKFEYLKGAVLENLVKRDPESNFTFKQLHNSMRNKKNSLSAIFEPEELLDSAGLVRLGDRFGNPVLSTSGTGASLSFQDLTKSASNLSVDALAIRNANKAAATKLTPASAAAGASAPRDVTPRLKELPAKLAGALAASPVDSKDTPKKGPEKWMKDGIDRVIKHDQSGIDRTTLESLKNTKKGRELLFRASSLSIGSKAMDKVLSEIKSANSKGAE